MSSSPALMSLLASRTSLCWCEGLGGAQYTRQFGSQLWLTMAITGHRQRAVLFLKVLEARTAWSLADWSAGMPSLLVVTSLYWDCTSLLSPAMWRYKTSPYIV